MNKYLITPSLINSYQYYINDQFKSPADSRADFLKTLSRKKFEPSEAMQKGIDFEEAIREVCETKEVEEIFHFSNFENYEERIREAEIVNILSRIVKGGIWQATCKKDLQVNDQDFLLYGRCDVIKADIVFDIKYTSKYELGKFSDSIQHLIYLYCLDLPKFSYLISNGKEWWREDYINNGNVENEIKSKISDFLGYLESDKEAKEMFFNKWQSID